MAAAKVPSTAPPWVGPTTPERLVWTALPLWRHLSYAGGTHGCVRRLSVVHCSEEVGQLHFSFKNKSFRRLGEMQKQTSTQSLNSVRSFENVEDMTLTSFGEEQNSETKSGQTAKRFLEIKYEMKCGIRGLWTYFAVYLLIFTLCIVPPFLALCLVALPFTHGFYIYGIFITAYCITQCLPPWYTRSYKQGPLGGTFIRELVNYMTPFTVVRESRLDPKQKYIICWHPHGRLFYGFGTMLGVFYEWFPEIAESGKEIFAGINDMMFRIPFVSNWLYLCGNIPCNKASLQSKLRSGDSVAIIVGGIDEILEGTFDDRDVLYLARRKGFCKLALDQGAHLVPAFCFGENSIYHHTPRSGLFGLDFWQRANRVLGRVGVPFPIRGVAGLPIPRRVPMMVAVGPPLAPQPGEDVESLHRRYVEALRALHARHVDRSPHPGRVLVIN